MTEQIYEMEEKTLNNFLKKFSLDFLFVLVVILCTGAGYWGMGVVFYVAAKWFSYNTKPKR